MASLLACVLPALPACSIAPTSSPLHPAAEPTPGFAAAAAAIATPALTSADGRTDQRELMAFVEQLAGQADHVHLIRAGRSMLGEDIPMLVFTRSADPGAATLRADGRPTVWVLAQQHGDEPAAGEGALALAAELAGPSRELIDEINVVIVPRANPDGASHGSRYATNGRDLNRDSIRQILAESRQLRKLNLAYEPVLTIDAHEYRPHRATLRQIEPAGVAELYDLMILGPENANVHPRLRELTRELFIAPTVAAVTAAGLSVHETTRCGRHPAGAPLHLALGETDARIGRNYHGLINQVSVLLESRGIGLGKGIWRGAHSRNSPPCAA
ncbi:MAG: M14 family zinc carboxypeptidase [Burkholderiaceae bacterium]